MSMVKENRFADFSAHPHCGMGTYLFFNDDNVKPLTKYVNVEKSLESIEKANEKLSEGKELSAKLEIASGFLKNVKFRYLAKYMTDVIKFSNYQSLNDFHHSMIMIGSMHFMDPYNFDLERVQKCVIHYATPDGKLIPFCTMNNFHRKTIETKFAKPFSADQTTPLYDVEALKQMIKLEDERNEQNPDLVEDNRILVPGNH